MSKMKFIGMMIAEKIPNVATGLRSENPVARKAAPVVTEVTNMARVARFRV